MLGTPTNDPEQLRKLVLELQGVVMVHDARFRALRRLVLEALEVLKVQMPDGTPLPECFRRLAEEELDVKLGTISDDDPAHASILKKYINAAKQQKG